MKGIVPFSQLFISKKDPLIKQLMMQKLKLDIQLFTRSIGHQNGIKAKIVKEFNHLANTGAINAPALDEDQFLSEWEKAMDYYLEDEFDFVANRIKEMVHGECIPQQGEGEESIDKSMYDAIIKYAKEDVKNLHLETYVKTSAGTRVAGFNFSTSSEEYPGATVVTALYYSFGNRKIILSSIEEDYAALRGKLGLDDESLDCTNNSQYEPTGDTTTTEDHSHTYTIDEFGNGRTTGQTPTAGAVVLPHVHGIASYAVIPIIGANQEVGHTHSLVRRAEEEEIQNLSDQQRIEKYMEDMLVTTGNFKILFDFCFDLREVSSLVLAYCILSSENQISFRAFSNTKKAIIEMFDWLWQEGPSLDPCEDGVSKKFSPDWAALFPNMGDAFLNPQYLLMMLLAPLMTFRGWTKTADPHVYITTTIMETLEMPLCPIWEERNIPNPLNDGKLECMTIPTWPGTRPLDNLFLSATIPAPVVEWGVAGAVTVAPMIVGLPPFTPTPFGLWYYALVAPSIWLLRDLPRLLELMSRDALAVQNLTSIGLHVEAPRCDLPTETGDGSEEMTETGCPPIQSLDDTILDISSPECADE